MPRPTPQTTTPAILQEVGKQIRRARVESGNLAVTRTSKKLTNEEIEQRLSHRLNLIDLYLDDETFLGKLSVTSLKDLGIYEGIQYDKLMMMRGVPNMIVSHQEHRQLDDLAPALLAEMKRRGLTAKITETVRTAEVSAAPIVPHTSS